MNYINKALCLLAVTVLAISSCSDLKFGDDFLGTAPEENEATLDTMFSSRLYSERVLTQAYSYLPYGLPTSNAAAYNKLGNNVLENLTDLSSCYRNNASDGPTKLYYNGELSNSHSSTGNEAYRYGAENDWYAIRYAWFYIENIDRVPDMTEAEKTERKAEAYMILAISYAEMLRYIGGFPYLDHAVDPTEDMTYPRKTFAESVEIVCDLCDRAYEGLDWYQTGDNDGRMTKAGALALKFRVQLFAASPMFNSNDRWHAQADEYTCYTNYDESRWTAARQTADQLLNASEFQAYYKLIEAEDDSHAAYRLAFRKAYYYRGGTEVLISTRRGTAASINTAIMDASSVYWGPTLDYVNKFPWADGSEFDAENFNWESPDRQPFFDENGDPTRDPRLYETCAVPGSLYRDGTLAPVYSNHPTSYQSAGTGFRMAKYILESNTERAADRSQWPYLRLPEVYLGYAEVLNQLNGGPTNEAYRYLNMVRARVGLSEAPSGMTQSEFLEYLLDERAREFGYEEVRWFDLIRYKREDIFRTSYKGLLSMGNTSLNPVSYTFEVVELSAVNSIHSRFWASTWDSKWYLAPIPVTEINKGYGMTQNPGWN